MWSNWPLNNLGPDPHEVENLCIRWTSASTGSQLWIENMVFICHWLNLWVGNPQIWRTDCHNIYWKKSTYGWTCAVPTRIVQGQRYKLTVHVSIDLSKKVRNSQRQKCSTAFLKEPRIINIPRPYFLVSRQVWAEGHGVTLLLHLTPRSNNTFCAAIWLKLNLGSFIKFLTSYGDKVLHLPVLKQIFQALAWIWKWLINFLYQSGRLSYK